MFHFRSMKYTQPILAGMLLYRHLEARLLLLEQSDDTTTLQERCLALQQQVEEMEVSNSCAHHMIYYSMTAGRSF